MHIGLRVLLSAFNIYVPEFPEPGETLVYNTFSGSSAVLDAGYLAVLRAAGAAAERDDDLADPEVGIQVESRAAEERDFQAWMRSVKYDTRGISALISTSYACNL